MSNNLRSTSPRPTRVPDKPAGVALNLDALTHEVTREPFVVIIGKKPRSFADPNDMDWRDMMAVMEDPLRLFRLALSEDDFDEVMAESISVRNMRVLVESYMAHYGIDLGNPPASRI